MTFSLSSTVFKDIPSTPTQSLNLSLFSEYKGPPRTTEAVSFWCNFFLGGSEIFSSPGNFLPSPSKSYPCVHNMKFTFKHTHILGHSSDGFGKIYFCIPFVLLFVSNFLFIANFTLANTDFTKLQNSTKYRNSIYRCTGIAIPNYNYLYCFHTAKVFDQCHRIGPPPCLPN